MRSQQRAYNRRRIALGAAFVLVLVVLPTPVLAQLQSGSISGAVTDQGGGVLPGATVSLSGPGVARAFATEPAGQYRFLNVPPGTYALTVSLPGFTSLVREGIVVTVGQTIELPVSLRVAAVAEVVTVTGASPIIDTRATGTSTNFTQDELARIPTSRDPWALLRTVPGIIVDRINVAGNETGQQSEYSGKGARRADSTWTIDGIIVTDTAATGASPTYFDYDAFDEIQISTGGHDIRQPTGGVGLNFVVKRGTNQFKGTARGYFTNDSMESSNVPAELEARKITPDRADHNQQISDIGFDLGGPIVRDRAWFFASWTEQDIRLIRGQHGTPILDRTILKTTNVKGNWQITRNDTFGVLWFNGAKEKFGRAAGRLNVEPATARWNQGNAYPEGRPQGLLKFDYNRVVTPNLFLTGKYAYYGTGFQLAPAGGLEMQTGRSDRLGETFGSVNLNNFLRPQTTFGADGNYFMTGIGGRHDFQFGAGYRSTDAFAQELWPGNMVEARDNSLTDQRARVYREGAGTDRTKYFSLYIGDSFERNRLTLTLGARYDRQWGDALPSATRSNTAFPNIVPGIQFDGYRSPFTWSDVSPRTAVSYALDQTHQTLLRASFSRNASLLNTGTVAYMNPSGSVGFADFPWIDANGDHFAQANEVNTRVAPIQFGGGFNPANPTAVTSANRIDPNLKAPITTALMLGVDRELGADLALQVAYNYARGTRFSYFPWRGVTPGVDYLTGPAVTGTLPDGTAFSIPTFIPDATKVAAGGNGRILSNHPGYYTTFNGLELSIVKRLSNRWMMRAATAYNNARQFWGDSKFCFDGNPTIRDASAPGGGAGSISCSLQDGAQLAPQSAGSGQGDIFINGKWMLNLNGVYQLPWDIELAGNLYGKQGTPFPIRRLTTIGVDGSVGVLVTAEIDTLRYENPWSLDLRLAKTLRARGVNALLVADLFNVTNNNVELARERNLASPNFNRLNQNLSPRIVRLGVRLGF
jgi:hypothetical protein